jgi:transcriptional regulator with XRE-family HTH domain
MLSLIGRRLRALRKSQNLSQREVADAIGLPQSNLSRIENGKQRLSLTVLSRMLGIYQTSIQDFFSREDEALRAGDALSAREQQLVDSFRRLSGEDRREVEGYVDYKLYRARRDRSPVEG